MTLLSNPPLPGFADLQPSRSPFLYKSNSGITQQVPCPPPSQATVSSSGFKDETIECPAAIWVMGRCADHGQIRWILVKCKRRTCEVCGPAGRKNIAEDIAFHVRMGMLAGERFAWLVLTFPDEIAEFSTFKPQAVRALASFVRWLRRSCGMSDLQYVATYELQQRGRLHINLICGPWKFVPHRRLLTKWGGRVSAEYVQDSEEIAVEAAASYSPEGLSGYVSKLESSVPAEWGRRVSFSQGWKKVPKRLRRPEREGEIQWKMPDGADLRLLDSLIQEGKVIKVAEGEYAHGGQYHEHLECHCYEWKHKRWRRRPREGDVEEFSDVASYDERVKESIALGGSYEYL